MTATKPMTIGIDFGTTNTVVALTDADGLARLVTFDAVEGQTTTFRSALSFQIHQGVDGQPPERVVEAGPWAIAAYVEDPLETRFIQSFKTFAASAAFTETRIDNLPSQKVFQRQGFFEAGRHIYAGAEHLAWVAPSARLAANQRLSLRILADEAVLEGLRRLLGVTGLADVSDEAEVSLFFDAASSEEAEHGRPTLHFNTTAGVILDLANDVPFRLNLPLEFRTVAVAVAQTAAALHHTASRA